MISANRATARRRQTWPASMLLAAVILGAAPAWPKAPDPRFLEPLPVSVLPAQGLHRTLRLFQPDALPAEPALVIALHGSGGTGERFRRLTDGAFDRLAEEHGFVVAYPDALGRQWHDCRNGAPYRAALQGVDDVAFLGAVADHVASEIGRPLSAVYVVGYSNGGHMAFRLAFEAPGRFDAFAAIGAHLPVAEERACAEPRQPVSMMLVSGTADPMNPWTGGPVSGPGNVLLGRVLSAEATADYFLALAGIDEAPTVEAHADVAPQDGATAITRHWTNSDGSRVALMAVDGGGHTLPHPTAPFPAALVGATCRDVNGAEAVWRFFAATSRPERVLQH